MDPLTYLITTLGNFAISTTVEIFDFGFQLVFRQLPDLIGQTIGSYKGGAGIFRGTGVGRNISQASKMFWKKYDTAIINYREIRIENYKNKKNHKLPKVGKDGLISLLDVNLD